jgi:hypothetical protein
MSRIPARRVSFLGLAACVTSFACFGCSSSDDEPSTNPGPSAGGQAGVGQTGQAGQAGQGGGAAVGVDESTVCASALFCDSFEDSPAGVAPAGAWRTNLTNGTVVVDTTRAFRGTQSVKASTVATDPTTLMPTYKSAFIGLSGAPVVPVPGQAFYGRMMFYLESSPTTSVHWTFVDATGLVPGQNYHATYRYGGQLPVAGGNQLMANYDTTDYYATPSVGPRTDCYEHADGKVVPVGKWTCAEWYFNGPNNEMKFWLDGAELPDLTIEGTGEGCVDPSASTWIAPTFSQLDVGWQSYQADDARSIWIDDVVIGSSKVGCPALPQ